jgi:hypothetical protein
MTPIPVQLFESEGREDHGHHRQSWLRHSACPWAPVNETDLVLSPQGLHALKQVAKQVGLDLQGAYLNLDGGFDSAPKRPAIY